MTDFYPAVVIAVFLAGSCAGRLLHHCTLVFPRHLSLTDQMRALWRERVCRSCGKPVSAIQHLPLVAWWVAGRCRSCGRRMDHRRPVVELITGLMLALLYWLEIPAFTEAAVAVSALSSPEGPPGPAVIDSLWSPLVWLHLRYLLHAAMLCGLIIATVIDFELRIIPDGCTVPVMLFAVLFESLLSPHPAPKSKSPAKRAVM